MPFGSDFSVAQRWRYALKPASWPKLLVPTLLGQALGVLAADTFSVAAALLGLLFTLTNGAFIVLMNDWGDREVDAIKRRMFPDGCSPKTIPDGILPARHLLAAGVAAGATSVLLAFLLGGLLDRPWLGPLGVVCTLTFVAYSLPPVALNYRGGGELLEALGVGLLLPLFHAHAQSGLFWAQAWWVLVGFVALSLASALASGLSDEESDRAGGKRTLATTAGNAITRRTTETLVLAGASLWFVSVWVPGLPAFAMVPAGLVVLGYGIPMLRTSPQATTGAFAAQGLYKRRLHHGVWIGASIVAVGLLLERFGSS